ncbi:MAG: hypothetical protein AB7H88_07690 [Vicinamibacterales bacterium]
MDATSFEFTMTMPGDPRLVATARDLASHAAGYARLGEREAATLADAVGGAATAAIEATRVKDAPIEFRFAREADTLAVTIACEVAAGAPVPVSSSSTGLAVRWAQDGNRQTCHIRQDVPA